MAVSSPLERKSSGNAFDDQPTGDPMTSLVADMRYALLSEVGAHTIYGHLARTATRADLRVLLERLAQESLAILTQVRALMTELGGQPPQTSRRRKFLAHALACLRPLIGIRPILRLCQHAAETISRSHARYAIYLQESGDLARARQCEQLSTTKLVHSQALSAWLSNSQHLA